MSTLGILSASKVSANADSRIFRQIRPGWHNSVFKNIFQFSALFTKKIPILYVGHKGKKLNDKTLHQFLAFVAGLALGVFLGALGAGIMGIGRLDSGETTELRERLEQVNRDIGTAVDAQREAAERASRLQTELQGVTDHARIIEEGTRGLAARTGIAETRSGDLAEQLGGIIDQSGELTDGINRASGSLEESRVLLAELGIILRGLPGIGGKED